MVDDDSVDGFVTNHQDRKSSGAKKRIEARPQRDGGKRMHRVGQTKERWRFDSSMVGDEDSDSDDTL